MDGSTLPTINAHLIPLRPPALLRPQRLPNDGQYLRDVLVRQPLLPLLDHRVQQRQHAVVFVRDRGFSSFSSFSFRSSRFTIRHLHVLSFLLPLRALSFGRRCSAAATAQPDAQVDDHEDLALGEAVGLESGDEGAEGFIERGRFGRGRRRGDVLRRSGLRELLLGWFVVDVARVVEEVGGDAVDVVVDLESRVVC